VCVPQRKPELMGVLDVKRERREAEHRADIPRCWMERMGGSTMTTSECWRGNRCAQ
jgi:hypothetical protein